MNNEFWMSNLGPEISCRSLNFIAIPGSHDSLTVDIDENSEIGPDARGAPRALINYFGYAAKRFLKRWFITQNQIASQQLMNGIRYFDLRIAIKNDKSDLFITHQLYSGKLKVYLKEILEFLTNHPKEIVLLDFNHIYLEKSDHPSLVQMILEIFGDMLAPFYEYQEIPSLNELWQKKHQVLIFYHYSNQINEKFWPRSIIPTYWPNTTDCKIMINFLETALKEKCKTKFHITQGILTPNWKTITFHPFSNLKTCLADQATFYTVNWLQSLESSSRKLINIVIADFVQDHEFIDCIIKLNY